jgi:DNA-binding winged helix-turn-helix (wHTH) protein
MAILLREEEYPNLSSHVSRYRFGEFVLSPGRRLLLREGQEQPLIPRYFDLLLFLIEHRHEAVHRRDIFDRVWSDVVVSDSALSQAIRTIRRTLGDDPRDPRFIRTVSRHGYRFVFNDVREEPDEETWPSVSAPVEVVTRTANAPPADAYEPLLDRITRVTSDVAEEEDQHEAAELLHTLGTDEALRRLSTRPGHALARALLRDTRWDVATAGAVPILGQPGAVAAARALIQLRLRRAARMAAARWAAASLGGGLAGAFSGAAGGLILAAVPGSNAPLAVVPVLAVVGAFCGAAGGAGVGGGLSAAEAVARSRRTLALIWGASIGGGVVGFAAQWLARWMLETLVGVRVEVGGGIEGLIIGTGAGLGYGFATAGTQGGLAAPRGRDRLRVAALTALTCGAGALAVTLAGRPLVGGTIHAIAAASQGSQAMLTPLARLLGEPDFGPVTSAIVGMGEGALFGFGVALGLTRRP